MDVQHQMEMGWVIGRDVEISAEVLKAGLLGPVGERPSILQRKFFPLRDDGNAGLKLRSQTHVQCMRVVFQDDVAGPSDDDGIPCIGQVLHYSYSCFQEALVICPLVTDCPLSHELAIVLA